MAASEEELVQSAIQKQAINLQEYLDRLSLLAQSPYKEYCDAFFIELCQANTVANIVMSGKIDLVDPKRQQILSYGVSILCDAGGVIAPLGTVQKAVDDIIGHFIVKGRQKRYKEVAAAVNNPLHFVIFAQALVDCLVLYFPRGWAEELDANDGKVAAKTLIKAIKGKFLELNDNMTLADKLDACLHYIINEELVPRALCDPSLVAGHYEQILLLAIAQALNLPKDFFLKTELFEETLAHLSQRVDALLLEKEESGAENINRAEILKEIHTAIVGPLANVTNSTFKDASVIGYQVEVPYDLPEERYEVINRFLHKLNPSAYIVAPGGIVSGSNFDGAKVEAPKFKFSSGANSSNSSARQSSPSHCSAALFGDKDKEEQQSQKAEKSEDKSTRFPQHLTL